MRILKQLPPLAAETLVVRLGRFPITNFFVGRWNVNGRTLILRADSAPCEDEDAREIRSAHGASRSSTSRVATVQTQGVPPAGGGEATCTFCPDRMESGGCTMTDSLPLRPETISI